ncbi:multicopper oxidase domain-containing protein [Nocardia wallacei]|uniref:multicopper oxidase domain-containing protein n=1 Tax=Nocardia wallacei TaxID=480035 RepID=UPI002457203C|nr:multicopper oxidase domain-containing protein [Nocardia wallacei]
MQIAMGGQLIGAAMVPDIMRFTVGAHPGRVQQIPQTLRTGRARLPRPAEPTATTRTAVLSVTIDPTMPPNFISSGMMTIDNLRFRDPDFDRPIQGSVEQWDIVNADYLLEVHDFHIHLVQFRVIGRQDYDIAHYLAANPPGLIGNRWTPSADPFTTGPLRPPAPYESAWKDTVRCPPTQITRILVRWPDQHELGFDPDATYPTANCGDERGYVFHCHLLDHEDHEMMLRMRIVATNTTDDTDQGTAQHTGH